jgi:hypothetical protein
MGLLAVCAVAANPAGAAAPAAASPPRAERTRQAEKARVVLELIPFVEWPPSPPGAVAPLVIGVLGDEAFAEAIRVAVASRPRDKRAIRTRSFRNLDEVDPCSILMIGPSKARLLPVILEFLDGWSGVLTVGDGDEFVERGGVVGLVELPDRIGFEINRDAARRADLHLSSQLLRLAERLLPTETGREDGS